MGITVILESVIGLFFIFLVVSLIVTAANELLAGILGLRASNMREGIKMMLGGNAEATARVFNHPLIVLSSKAAKRGPAYIPGANFAEVLCDYISSAGKYAVLGGHYLQGFDLSAKITTAPLPDEVKKLVASFATAAKNDVEAFKVKISGWFDQTMERVSGWYNRTMRLISLLLGLLIAIIANIDTLVIASAIGGNDAARSAIVGQAIEYIKANPGARTADGKNTLSADITVLLEKDIGRLEKTGLIGWGKGARLFAIDEKDGAPLIVKILLKALGFLATALAASLGAPFWFDLLGRFVNMRSSLSPTAKAASTRSTQTSDPA